RGLQPGHPEFGVEVGLLDPDHPAGGDRKGGGGRLRRTAVGGTCGRRKRQRQRECRGEGGGWDAHGGYLHLVRCGIADSQNLYAKNKLLTIPVAHVTQPLSPALGKSVGWRDHATTSVAAATRCCWPSRASRWRCRRRCSRSASPGATACRATAEWQWAPRSPTVQWCATSSRAWMPATSPAPKPRSRRRWPMRLPPTA